jgi:hypothetical protein
METVTLTLDRLQEIIREELAHVPPLFTVPNVVNVASACRTPYGMNPKCNGHVTPGGKHVRCSPCESQLAKESTAAKMALDAFGPIPIATTMKIMVERRWEVNLNVCRK